MFVDPQVMDNDIRVFLVKDFEIFGEFFDGRGDGGFRGLLLWLNVFSEVVELSIGDERPEKLNVLT